MLDPENSRCDFKSISVRIPLEEDRIFDLYCKKVGRTKTDVLREFIRSLAQKEGLGDRGR